MKKKKLMTGITAAFVLTAGLFFGSHQVRADTTIDQMLDGSRLTEELSSEGFYQPLERWYYMALGRVRVTNTGNGTINIYGATTCLEDCETVYLNLYLEQDYEDAWKSYKSWEFTASNTDGIWKSITLSVPKGHYYRGRAYHAARKNGIKDSGSSFTNGIPI